MSKRKKDNSGGLAGGVLVIGALAVGVIMLVDRSISTREPKPYEFWLRRVNQSTE